MSSIQAPLGACLQCHRPLSARLDLLFVLDPSLMLPNTVAWPHQDYFKHTLAASAVELQPGCRECQIPSWLHVSLACKSHATWIVFGMSTELADCRPGTSSILRPKSSLWTRSVPCRRRAMPRTGYMHNGQALV